MIKISTFSTSRNTSKLYFSKSDQGSNSFALSNQKPMNIYCAFYLYFAAFPQICPAADFAEVWRGITPPVWVVVWVTICEGKLLENTFGTLYAIWSDNTLSKKPFRQFPLRCKDTLFNQIPYSGRFWKLLEVVCWRCI